MVRYNNRNEINRKIQEEVDKNQKNYSENETSQEPTTPDIEGSSEQNPTNTENPNNPSNQNNNSDDEDEGPSSFHVSVPDPMIEEEGEW